MSSARTHQPVDVSLLPAEHLSFALPAVDVADAIEALEVRGVPPAAAARLAAIIDRHERAALGVPVSSAATMLGVRPRTVRQWIDGGILEPLPGSTPKQVTVLSLGTALAAVHRLRDAGQDRNRFRLILDELDDRRTRAELSDQIDALARREWTAMTDNEIARLLETTDTRR